MTTQKWLIKVKEYYFPAKWTKEQVISYINEPIKVCQYCGKIDAGLNHYSKCPQFKLIEQ